MEIDSNEMLKEAEEFGSYFFTEKEIATILGIKALTPELKEAVMRGQLKQMATIRKSIFSHAAAGSTPAQNQALQIIQKYFIQKEYERP